MVKRLRIGSRGSKLAVLQAESVRNQLMVNHADVECEMVTIATTGDRNTAVSLDQLGGDGVFVKELEEALLGNEIDIAVHSLKDMLTTLPEGLILAAVPPRVDPRDALISPHGKLEDLPPGARIGTGSLRRAVQLRAIRPDLEIGGLRGNIDTRIRKAFSGEFDGIVMAAAALLRLDMEDRITEYLPVTDFVPAVGQGALGIEIRYEDDWLMKMIKPLNDQPSWQSITAERAFLRALGGGCRAPIAALGIIEHGILKLNGIVADTAGKRLMRDSIEGAPEDSEAIGKSLASKMIDLGADELIVI